MFVQKVSTALAAFPRAGRKNWTSAALDTFVGGRNRPLPSIECRCGFCLCSPAITLGRPVFFVYRSGTSARGSVRIRVFQAVAGLRRVVSNPGLVNLITEEHLRGRRLTNVDLVFSKYLLTYENLALFRGLRAGGNRVFVDVVDGFPVPGLEKHIDAFLCASRSEFEHRLSMGVPAVELLHQVDTRFGSQPFGRSDFTLGYLGGNDGSVHLSGIPNISTHFTGLSMSSREARNASRAVARWSHHYSVRTFPGDGVHKPATKVFLAARFGAVFLGSRDDNESLLILGPDYPYLARTSALHDVQELLSYAEETFGGPAWEAAVGVMGSLREISCDISIARTLANFLNHNE